MLPILVYSLFGTCLFIQSVFWFWIVRRKALTPCDPLETDIKRLPPISVIICGRNESKFIQNNLNQFLQQDYSLYEIIYVDDDSSDDSLEQLGQIQNTRLVVCEHKKENPGKRDALKEGMRKAHYHYWVLTDADCSPKSNQWLKHYGEAFSKGASIVLGVSPIEKTKGFLNTFIRAENVLEIATYVSLSRLGFPYMGVGRNMGYTKEIGQKSKSLHSAPLLSGDDDLVVNELANKSNTFVIDHPDSYIFSPAKKSIAQYIHQKQRHLSAGKHYKRKDKLLIGTLALSHTLSNPILIIPFLLTGAYPLAILWIIRTLLFISLFTRLSHRYNMDLKPYQVLLFDLGLIGYYGLFTNYIFWKNEKKWDPSS